MSEQLPKTLVKIIDEELRRLEDDTDYDLLPQRRFEIYNEIGPSFIPDAEAYRQKIWKEKLLPNLTTADRVRTRTALLTAYKIASLWDEACKEADVWHENQGLKGTEIENEEEQYLYLFETRPIEEIHVFRVPRTKRPTHIISMAKIALKQTWLDYQQFSYQSNELWGLYGRPEGMWREYFIKWGIQEALYEALAWRTYLFDIDSITKSTDELTRAYNHEKAPAGKALLAYAGVFQKSNFHFDKNKLREFWRWWLSETIPIAWNIENP